MGKKLSELTPHITSLSSEDLIYVAKKSGGSYLQRPISADNFSKSLVLTEDTAPTSADLLVMASGEKVTIGNLFRNIPDGSVAAPAIARGAQQDVGLIFEGNTLVIQNLQTDHSVPLMIKGSTGHGGLAFLDPGTGTIRTWFEAGGGFTSSNWMAISGDFAATYNESTGIVSITSYGTAQINEPSFMFGISSDVYGPAFVAVNWDNDNSLLLQGKLRGTTYGYPNFQIDRRGNIDIFDSTILGTENLTEGNFATHVNWDTTGDFNDTAGNAKYTHNTGAGTLTQVSADLAVALKGNRWYKLVYTVSGVVGSPTANIPATVSHVAKSLSISNGVAKILIFKTIAAPTDFIINGTSTTATHSFTLDDLSLKEIQDGDINICGKLYLSSFQTTTGAAAGTLTNAPTVGDPEGYLKIVIDGAEKAIPYWDVP